MAEATSSTKHPEEIFPLEVWKLIFDKLKSPTDVAICFRTCRAFRELLEPTRILFLMPEVLPILCKYLRAEPKEDKDNDGEPAVTQNLLLNMRLMCKFWKISVDNHLGNPDYLHSSDSSCFSPRKIRNKRSQRNRRISETPGDSLADLFGQIIIKARLYDKIRPFKYRIQKN